MTTDPIARDSEYWMAQESEYYVHTFNRQPIVVARGEGARIWDVEGNEYLDFTAGLAVTCLGHSHPVVDRGDTGAGRDDHADVQPLLHRAAA